MTVSGYTTVIGLEVHAQLATRSKLFSPTPVGFGGPPNSRVGVVELGLPGVLPVLNEAAVRLAVRAGLALECEIHRRTRFERKNYFYPDLPKGYQISQYREPLCTGGAVPLGDGRAVPLTRIHLEEDAGKSTHTDQGSLVDLDRAGVPLIEIVAEPAIHEPTDAHTCLVRLQEILRYAGVSHADMEKGELRCDANVSLMPAGTDRLGTRVEIKNLNSFKMVQRALEYEERRQAAVLAAGGAVAQETRLWNDETGETAAMRSKEEAEDYRYFPDPDLPVVMVDEATLDEVRAAMPELPDARRARWRAEYGLSDYDLGVLMADKALADWFEALARESADARAASSWVQGEVLRELGEREQRIDDLGLEPRRMAGLLAAVQQGRVNRQAAKKVFRHLLDHPVSADEAIAALGVEQLTDPADLAPVIEEVLAAQPRAVADYRAGRTKALHSLKGRVMQATGGRAAPELVERLLLERLDAGG